MLSWTLLSSRVPMASRYRRQLSISPRDLVDHDLAGAACRGREPEFDSHEPKQESFRTYKERLLRARRVCRRCPVLDACRAAGEALPEMQRFGIWAGSDLRPPVSQRVAEINQPITNRKEIP